MNIQKCFIIVGPNSECDFQRSGPDTWHLNHVATIPGKGDQDQKDLLGTIVRFFADDLTPQFVSGPPPESEPKPGEAILNQVLKSANVPKEVMGTYAKTFSDWPKNADIGIDGWLMDGEHAPDVPADDKDYEWHWHVKDREWIRRARRPNGDLP